MKKKKKKTNEPKSLKFQGEGPRLCLEHLRVIMSLAQRFPVLIVLGAGRRGEFLEPLCVRIRHSDLGRHAAKLLQ